MHLLHIPEEGDGKAQPPQRGDQDGEFLRDRAAVAQPQQHPDGHNKGDGAAADVTHGVAPGRDPVHAVMGGDVCQEAVIKKVGSRKADMRYHIAYQHHAPVIGQGDRSRKACADQQEKREQLLFHALVVGDRAQDGREQGDKQSGKRRTQAPPVITVLAGEADEDGGEDGSHDVGGINGVGPIVEYPASLLEREALAAVFLHGGLL